VSATYVIGDVRDCLAALPDGSVDLVLTSPPFLALRSYLPADHPDKHREIGAEPTPAAFVDTLLGLSAEWRRVLAPHGSIAVELGDTYSGSGGAGGDYADDGMRSGQAKFRQGTPRWDGRPEGQVRTTTSDPVAIPKRAHNGWPSAKSLTMIPELYRVALAYGINPLTGNESPAGRWRCRNVIRWCRPNPPVGALGDKVRPATSDMVIACVAKDRYFDLDAIREPSSPNTNPRTAKGVDSRPNDCKTSPDGNRDTLAIQHHHTTAPPLDHWWADPDTFDNDAWMVSTEAYAGAHYATWPRKLLTRPILAMCPQKVCRTCGQPSRRIASAITLDSYRGSERPQTVRAVALADEAGLTDLHVAAIRAFGTSDAGKAVALNDGAGKNTDEVKRLAAEAKAVLGGYFREFVMTTNIDRSGSTWSDCGHDDYRPGVVLDPFAGSGTTLAVATGHGRDAIGFDIDARNAEQAMERVGPMFLTVHDLADWHPQVPA
jgi:hypothetical protein